MENLFFIAFIVLILSACTTNNKSRQVSLLDINRQFINKEVGYGNPTNLELFIKPFQKAFNRKCMVLVQSTKTAGEFTLRADSEGLTSEKITIKTGM